MWDAQSARPLPWRGETDPYRVWLSEIMLQQTRAETVIPYYHRFLDRFPDIHALAAADQETVLKLWEGLGYYSRARNLHRAATVVVDAYHGRFPDTVKEIRALPGVGEYTAGAIASIAFHLPEPAIDGNQIRVLSRLFGVREPVHSSEGKRKLRAGAEMLLPRKDPGEFNQALMGLGAMICLPRKPRCELCPARVHCAAHAAGEQELLPVLPPKITKSTTPVAVVMVFWENKVFVRRRPDSGLLAGLWEFPCFENAKTKAAVIEALREIGIDPARVMKREKAEHVFTHKVWKMTGWVVEAAWPSGEAEGCFVSVEELQALPIGTALRAYRASVMERLTGR